MVEAAEARINLEVKSLVGGDPSNNGMGDALVAENPPLTGENPDVIPRSRKRIFAPVLVLVTFMILTPPACYLAGIFHVILTGELERSAFASDLAVLALELGAGFLVLGLYWGLVCGIIDALYRGRQRSNGSVAQAPPWLSERQKALLACVLIALVFASPAVAYGASGALYTGLGLWGTVADGRTSIYAVTAFTLIESFLLGTYWYAAVRLFAYAATYARSGQPQ